jgi:hypothetical protein
MWTWTLKPLGTQAVGRPLPEVEENPSVVSMLEPSSKGYDNNHEKGLTKEESDFQNSPEHSKPRGDPLCPHPDKTRIFRVYSLNPNGLSSKDDHADVLRMLQKAIKNKEVALLSLQETNRNFEKPAIFTERYVE